MVKNLDNNEIDEYIATNKSDTVNRYFDSYVNKKLEIKEEEEKKHSIERERNEFIKRLKMEEEIRQGQKRYIEWQNSIKERANTPYLQLKNRYKDNTGKIYSDYDGINVSEGEEKGYILRIRQLDKIGKDGSGTYLYSGYICNNANETDAELIDYSTSTAVCFELYRRLDDIIKDSDPKEIQDVLSFLSNPINFKNNDKLNYIGHLDRVAEIQPNGEIRRTVVERRERESNSPSIAAQIKRMQQQYDRKNEQSR